MSTATKHWWRMRLSSVLLVPLTAWLLWAGVSLAGADYGTAAAFMAQPFNVVAAVLFVLITAYHTQAGITEIVEDYVPGEGTVTLLIGITRGACLAAVLAVLWAVYRIAAGAA